MDAGGPKPHAISRRASEADDGGPTGGVVARRFGSGAPWAAAGRPRASDPWFVGLSLSGLALAIAGAAGDPLAGGTGAALLGLAALGRPAEGPSLPPTEIAPGMPFLRRRPAAVPVPHVARPPAVSVSVAELGRMATALAPGSGCAVVVAPLRAGDRAEPRALADGIGRAPVALIAWTATPTEVVLLTEPVDLDVLAPPLAAHLGALRRVPQGACRLGIAVTDVDAVAGDELLALARAALHHHVGPVCWHDARTPAAVRAREALCLGGRADGSPCAWRPVIATSNLRLVGAEVVGRDEQELAAGDLDATAQLLGEVLAWGALWARRVEGFSATLGVDARALREPRFVRMVTRLLELRDLDPEVLRIEVPRVDVRLEDEALLDGLRALGGAGVGLVAAGVAITDTLDGLAGLPFAAVSVDPGSARDGEALRRGLEGLTGRAADLGLGVQAARVRTATELSVLRAAPAVIAARGPAVAGPVSAATLDALARRGGPLGLRAPGGERPLPA